MNIDSYDIFPCPGRAFVALEPNYKDIEGMIYIPKTAKRAQLRTGLCIAVSGYPRDQRSHIFSKGQIFSAPAYKMNETYAAMINKKVIVTNARMVKGWIFEVRLSDIEAVAGKHLNVEASEEAVERCPRCRTKGEGNIMLGPAGYCPQCKFNLKGEHEDHRQFTLSGEMEDFLGDDLERLKKHQDQAVNPGRIISFGGGKELGT